MSSDALRRITELATTMRQAKVRLDTATAEAAEAKEEYQRLEREDLPTLMGELGLAQVKLSDGSVIEIVDEVDASISEARRSAAHAWLVENGFSGIIKSNLSVEFERSEWEAAKQLAEKIADMSDHPVNMIEKVHPMTLKSFVKEQLAAGTAVPFDLFGVHPFSRAKLKASK